MRWFIVDQMLHGTVSLSGYTRIPRDVWVRLGAQSNKDLKVTGRNAGTKYWRKDEKHPRLLASDKGLQASQFTKD